jgi:hypothetical protein
LSTGQIPAEFAVPKNDGNNSNKTNGTGKDDQMEVDKKENQDNISDQNQEEKLETDRATPIEEVAYQSSSINDLNHCLKGFPG